MRPKSSENSMCKCHSQSVICIATFLYVNSDVTIPVQSTYQKITKATQRTLMWAHVNGWKIVPKCRDRCLNIQLFMPVEGLSDRNLTSLLSGVIRRNCFTMISDIFPLRIKRIFAVVTINGKSFDSSYATPNIIPIQISLKLVPGTPIDNMPALVQVMAWRRTEDNPLPEPMLPMFIHMRH